MKLRFSLTATRQIDEIHDGLAGRNEKAARDVVEAIHSACWRFVDFPLMGRPGKLAETKALDGSRTAICHLLCDR